MKKVMVAIQVGLAVFFLGMMGASATEPELEESSNGNWQYHEMIDRLTDEDSSFVANTTAEGAKMFFFVSCNEDHGPTVGVSFGTLIRSIRERSQRVEYRFLGEEDGDLVEGSWMHVGGEILFSIGDEVPTLLHNFRTYSTFIIRTWDHRSRAHTLEFDLSGEDDFLSRLSCVGPMESEDDIASQEETEDLQEESVVKTK